ncbi:MAG: M23 family metallopeptidase [Bacteroidales bacterium]|nr:M23 family metallopeptidase [Bacteroidales bacterium]
MNRLVLQLFFLILVSKISISQNYYPQNYFISPLDNPIALSGTFGELRADHFHSGIDIRTGEVEGLQVHAVADGWVSRIKIAPGGYGNALYITHPNGYTSVYGHLQRYNNEIAKFAKQNQYELESFEVDLYLKAGQIQVKQGDVIAWSGNTGRSGGPHLHFEIRDSNQDPINPVLFGIELLDQTPPVINTLKVYPAGYKYDPQGDDGSRVYFTQKTGDGYLIARADTISVAPFSYFGINTFDPFNNGLNKNGVYSIKLYADSNLVYEHQLETFSFAESRYINSLIDYKDYIQNKRRIQKSYIEPNNHLSIYHHAKNRGIINFSDGNAHLLSYEISDIAGNTSILNFWAKSANESEWELNSYPTLETKKFSYLSNNIFQTADLYLQVPGDALYDSINFTYQTKPGTKDMFSDIHHLHFDYVPLHKWCGLSIRTDSIEPRLRNKALIVKIDKDGFDAAGGTWENGFIITSIREFGNYCVVVDTVPPEIKALNVSNNENIQNQQSIRVKITDELSGIESYRGTLNGKWILMEYDEKNDLLIYNFDEHLLKGQNHFELVVKDKNQNTSTLNLNLIY